MSFQVTESMVQQYGGNFRILSQQKQSRLLPFCQLEGNIVGASKSVERLGKAEAIRIDSRHSDTKFVEVPHSRRWLDVEDWTWAELVDELDKKKMLADPTSPYAGLAVDALNRRKDAIIYAAARGTARTGTGTQALPSGQKIVHGSANLTLAKLLTAKEILDAAEVDDDASMSATGQSNTEQATRVIVVNAKMLTSLYGTTEIKSVDYNSVKALAQGQIDTFLGFKFIRYEGLYKDGTATTGYATCWARSCMALGVGADVQTDISIRNDKNNAAQVYARMSLGAVRLEDEGVVEIACA